MKARGGVRSLAGIGAVSALAFAVSGLLYFRSRSADFHRHAEAVEAFGEAARSNELVSKQIIASRFGLLNQYDPLNATELDLLRSKEEIVVRVVASVGTDAGLDEAFRQLESTVADQGRTIERFKAENSILKNSVYYLPTAARELVGLLPARTPRESIDRIRGLTEAALLYDLIGDESARDGYAKAVAGFEAAQRTFPAAAAEHADLLLAHARTIRDKQAAVDGWVQRAIDSVVGQRLSDVQRRYDDRFAALVSRANTYRKILYAWSILLAFAAAAASVSLRRLYTGLERRVADRTADLAKALDALWGEMRLARKIQEALVPASPHLADCEVAVTMKPAEEVGGDYYDVVTAGGREWILIGDVSGHGVPAGLVMMMCHTAVRTILRGNPSVEPHQLLAQVNGVLTENIRQLGEDKYMTITAFRRDPDGSICFAGAHQDVFVYRTATDAVETVATEGIWLGLKDDIADSLSPKSLTLASGDVLVMYTDGITEAMRDGAAFDTTGLRDVLSLSRGRTARQILDETFRALEGFEVDDDATMLVLRQA